MTSASLPVLIVCFEFVLLRVLNMEELTWTEEEEESTEHPYYNNIPGKMPPPGGIVDTRLTNQNAAQDGCQVAFLTLRQVAQYLLITVSTCATRWVQDL